MRNRYDGTRPLFHSGASWAFRPDPIRVTLATGSEASFTLVGQYNAESGRNDNFQAVPRVPSQIPGLLPSLAPLYRLIFGHLRQKCRPRCWCIATVTAKR